MVDLTSARLLLALLTGWLNRRQQEGMAYLIEENRILRGTVVPSYIFRRSKGPEPNRGRMSEETATGNISGSQPVRTFPETTVGQGGLSLSG